MSKKKVCKRCKAIVDGDVCPVGDNDCPVTKHNQYSTNFQGRVFLIKPEESKIAHKINIEKKGEYAIKVR